MARPRGAKGRPPFRGGRSLSFLLAFACDLIPDLTLAGPGSRRLLGERSQNISSDEQFLELIQLNPAVNEILTRLDELNVPDAWLVSGCLFQTVWNLLAAEHSMRAIKDYDVFYFDETDTSAEAEDEVNRRAAEAFGDLGCGVDVRNQARVHIWYESEFGVAGYPRLQRSTDGIDNFLAVCCMVGVKKTRDGSIYLYAPFGTDDVLARVMRQNPWYPNAPRECYEIKAERWKSLWPALRVEPFVSERPSADERSGCVGKEASDPEEQTENHDNTSNL